MRRNTAPTVLGNRVTVLKEFCISPKIQVTQIKGALFVVLVTAGSVAGWFALPKYWGDKFVEEHIFSNDRRIEIELFNMTGAGIGACAAAQLLC